jgi:phosphatidate cytidylyltransferase
MVRLVTGVLLAAAFLALVWFANTTVLLMVALAVAALAVHEYVQLFRPLGAYVPSMPTLIATLVVTATVPFPRVPLDAAIPVGFIAIAVWAMATVKSAESFGEASRGAAAGALAVLYIGIGIGTLVGIHASGGRGAVLLLMATIVISDTAQYYAGRTFGRHPLAPTLSPKKTVEGAIGGFVVAPVFLVFAAYYLVPEMSANPWLLGLLGVGLVVAGIAGDLFESMLKRAAGVKDSSALIPGHGGVLDRIDALLFASPLFYVFVRELLS